jgi:hypothetical protein
METRSAQIFDRKPVLEVINRDCLGEVGSSAVVIGAPKVGKSHLLDYIYTEYPRMQKTLLFCQINVDLLRATLSPGEELSDHLFLRFFLKRLLAQLNKWIADQSLDEPSWRQDIDEAKQRAEQLARQPDDQEAQVVRKELDTKIKAYEQELRELEVLRDVAKNIRQLVDQLGQLRVPQVVYVFDDLDRVRKRIILIIDDFDRMLREARFSDELFHFLRGAKGKIAVLVSSRVRLMDPSLHPADRLRERQALVNAFQPQPLDLFSSHEAEVFLDWAMQATPALTPEEKNYICELGGGSPYFLRIALQQFLVWGRPTPGANRQKFEQQYVLPCFDAGFWDLWQRCLESERTLLRHLAAGETAGVTRELGKLKREGYVVDTETGPKPFSRVFAEFVRQQVDETPAADVRVSVTIPRTAFPAALYFAMPGLAEPVLFSIQNLTSEMQDVEIFCELARYSNEARRLVHVPAQQTRREELRLTIREEVKGLRDPITADLRYGAVVTTRGRKRDVERDSKQVKLLPMDHFILARSELNSLTLTDSSWLIAAWVQKNEPALYEIRRRAHELHNLTGYQVASGNDVPNGVRAQVDALYRALADEKLNYDNSAMVFHQDVHEFAQRVRMPARSLRERAANCLDASVLFASLLSASDLHPLILILPGHALVGWKDQDGAGANYEFLETTVMRSKSFEEACQIGGDKYRSFKELCSERSSNPSQPLVSLRRFAILIDVHQELQTRQLVPLRPSE